MSIQHTCSDYARALLLISQAPRWRSLLLACVLLTIACWTWRASEGGIPHASLSWPEHRSSGGDVEEAVHHAYTKPSNITLGLESGEHQLVPARLKKENPQFHLLIHAPKIDARVCRCLLSSYVLDYPPPTLVGYQPPPDLPSPQSVMTDTGADTEGESGIPHVAEFLKSERRIKDNDAVLVVDGASTLFQLPSDALLSSFVAESRQRNKRLANNFPHVTLQSPEGDYTVQRFNQSVLFASSRETSTIPAGPPTTNFLGRTTQAAPVTAVENTLNDAAIVGTAKSLSRLFSAANRANRQNTRSDTATFRTMLAQQLRTHLGVFTPLRQRRGIWGIWKLWLGMRFSVDAAVRAEEDKEARAAAVRDLGIGLDDRSRMMYSVPDAQIPDRGIGYVERANASTSGLNMPKVLMAKGARGPFALHPSHLHLNSTPPPQSDERHEQAEDELPDEHTPWNQIPLLFDPQTGNIPSLLSGSSLNDVWEKLWFQPYARTLLNQYLTRSRSKEIASEAAVGGERWWDSRGGRGGVWTTWGEWIDAGDLCDGYSAQLFRDGEDIWEENRKVTESPGVRYITVPVAEEKEEASGGGSGDEQQQTQSQPGQAQQPETGEDGQQTREQQQAEESQAQSTPPAAAEAATTTTEKFQNNDSDQQNNNNPNQQETATPDTQNTALNEVEEKEQERAASAPASTPHDDEQNDMPVAIMPDGTARALSELGSTGVDASPGGNGQDDGIMLVAAA